jgi:hypothetical protein
MLANLKSLHELRIHDQDIAVLSGLNLHVFDFVLQFNDVDILCVNIEKYWQLIHYLT